MAKHILTVTLNPALDHFMPANVVSAGGKGINVSRCLQRLGMPTIATGILGGAAGDRLAQLLRQEGVAADFLKIRQETRTNITVSAKGGKEGIRFMGIGPSVASRDLVRFERNFIKLLKNCHTVTFNGKMIPGAPADYYARLIRLAKKAGVCTALDSSGAEFREGLKAKPFIIKPNAAEAQEVLQMRVQSLSDMRRALSAFQRRGIGVILITLAEEGAAAIFKEERWYCRVPKVKIKNTIGCGDAFLGGFLDAAGRGRPFAEALQRAAAAGTDSCRSAIPGAVRAKELKALIGRIRLKKL